MTALVAQLTIDWENLPTYNTIMAVAAGAGLYLVARLGRELLSDPREVSVDGYSVAFGILAFTLITTGLHMTLTWPLAPAYPFDNIVFGEASLGFGVLLAGASFFGWRRGAEVMALPDPVGALERIARPTSIFVAGMGLGMIGIAAAGMRYQLFVAPPVEPIAGWWFSRWPWVEATFISGLYLVVGVGAVALTVGLHRRGPWYRIAGLCFWATGVTFLVFGAINYFSHIGLIVETMG
ncbi:DUF981 family protein [Ilumatobacter sp.]|uniref:DUF981 family protein n=1 Tax=Ilumatobacter sp. TaxID=1967498 RepID=UPI003B51E226